VKSVPLSYDAVTGLFYRQGKVVGSNMRQYVGVWYEGRIWLAHRLAWIWTYGEIPVGLEIDHINRIKTDNRISNLRLVTKSENQFNTDPRTCSSKYKGVYFNKLKGKWKASCDRGDQRAHLGYFGTEEEAAVAYNNYVKTLNIKTARLNEL
jgi:hypothetical protein